MESAREPLQGVLNIIRFNWHFYLLSGVSLLSAILFRQVFPAPLQPWIVAGAAVAAGTILVSLMVSWHVYDRSNLYDLPWLDDLDGLSILNIHAGFDETTVMLRRRFPRARVKAADFYDPVRHTEVSIRRARRAFPPQPGTVSVRPEYLPFADGSFDRSLAILSAHEIRNKAERAAFFRELRRITDPAGEIRITEHLRDLNNFLAYTVGFFHFHARSTWFEAFNAAGLQVVREINTTPFVTTFVLKPHETTH